MVKIEFDSWGTWTVEYGTFYGMVDLTKQSWMVENAGSKKNAERISRNADRITAVLGDRKHIRLTITFTDDTMTISNYDWDNVIATDVPALP